MDVNVSNEMETSFLEYAYSVIYSRALPDARDGLKPVQRRILYIMREMGLRPDKPHIKCARVVGQVMGLLHPHGDTAIYDALVRLGQNWAMRLPFIDGHGNFGSLDAGPAAYRYTECRLAQPALAMTEGLEEDAVDFRPNYDGKETEPAVLPAAIPNLLVNGATGIAVGMATNMAPHNLIEVVGGLRYLLKNPDAELDELMRFIPGPDFPSGGKIVGLKGVRDAYETGRGSLKQRATTRIEQVTARRKGIIVTELPYMVGPEKIIEQIKQLVQKKRIKGISDVKDLTDLEHGTRLEITVKNGINPDALLEQLFKMTKLEDNFAINNVALVEGQPRTLNLKQMLQVYLDHRLDVTLRRAKFQLNKATERLHLVEGMLLAIVDIDDVIAIIRSSEDVAEARTRLIEAFELSEAQANYILDLQLRRLTKLSKLELEAEQDELLKRIAELNELINDEGKLAEKVSDDLSEVAKKYGTPRRTVLLEDSGSQISAATPLEVPDDPCLVMLGSTGLLARMEYEEDKLPSLEGQRARHDAIISCVRTTARGEFGLLTNTGRLLRAQAIELPTVPVTAQAPNLQGGSRVQELYPLESNEEVIGLCRITEEGLGLAVGTANGVVKRVTPSVLTKDDWPIITLEDGDSLVGALELSDEKQDLVFITSDAQLLRFEAAKVRPQGRAGKGVAGIKLAAKAKAIWFGAVSADDSVVVTVSG
ncbi:DNA gyrase/topoisomerase IV subunit A, partial [Propionimicrobium lymphophilum]|uniref:DNA gyrase/topoisomerase IV subunit A n=1 Tax=Propionimicrobium lymphophilum TaxID=33012 RepID=UPI0023F57C70